METGQRQQVEQNEVKQVEGLKNKTGNVFFFVFHYTIFLSVCYDDHRLSNY